MEFLYYFGPNQHRYGFYHYFSETESEQSEKQITVMKMYKYAQTKSLNILSRGHPVDEPAWVLRRPNAVQPTWTA